MRLSRYATVSIMTVGALAFRQNVSRLNNDARHAVRVKNSRSVHVQKRKISCETICRQNREIQRRRDVHCASIVADVHVAKTHNRRALAIVDFIRQVDDVCSASVRQSVLENFRRF